MTFAEAMATDPPRLVVMFARAHDGSEQFQWGISGKMPLLSLIGHVARVQADLLRGLAERHECPQSALVIAWDGIAFDWFVHPDVPVDPLVGMLETVKAMLVDSRMVQHAASQRVSLLGPDGKPMR